MRVRLWGFLVACGAIVATGCLGGPHVVSTGPTEVQVTGISFTQIPASGAPNATLTVCWRVEGNGTIPETSIITDTVHPNRPDHPDFMGPTYYPDNASQPRVVALPSDLCTGVRLPASGVLYVRAFANSTATKTETVSELRTIAVAGSTDA